MGDPLIFTAITHLIPSILISVLIGNVGVIEKSAPSANLSGNSTSILLASPVPKISDFSDPGIVSKAWWQAALLGLLDTSSVHFTLGTDFWMKAARFPSSPAQQSR